MRKEKAILCPFCGSSNITTVRIDSGVRACCLECQAAGPNSKDEAEAVATWNGQKLRRPGPPKGGGPPDASAFDDFIKRLDLSCLTTKVQAKVNPEPMADPSWTFRIYERHRRLSRDQRIALGSIIGGLVGLSFQLALRRLRSKSNGKHESAED